jgi:hypothetical protein
MMMKLMGWGVVVWVERRTGRMSEKGDFMTNEHDRRRDLSKISQCSDHLFRLDWRKIVHSFL